MRSITNPEANSINTAVIDHAGAGKATAIQVEGLSKRFPKTSGYRDVAMFWRRRHVVALEHIDLSIPEGGVFGLLGPNGAGKTTLLKVLAGFVLPDSGSVLIDGYDVTADPDDVKGYLTYVSGDERTLYWRITGRQNLRFFATLNEIPRDRREQRIEEMLELVGLTVSADERVANYSSGMKQRLAIARGLLADPEILLLDEPTRSLDPLSARELQNFIREELIGRQEKTVILATHNMEEATLLCDRVAILHRGRVRACDSVDAVVQQLTGWGRCQVTVDDAPAGLAGELAGLPGVISVHETPQDGLGGTSFNLLVNEPKEYVPLIAEHLVRGGLKVLQVSQTKPSLMDAIALVAEEESDSSK